MKTTGWRRIASAMWRNPNDPQIYGILEVDATPLVTFIEQARAAGIRLTATHLVGRAIALALKETPDFNVRIVGGRAIPRRSVDIFFITAVGGGRDLSGVKIERADEKPAEAIATELHARASALKHGRDPAFSRTKRMMEGLPHFILRPLIWLVAYLAGKRDLKLPWLGVERGPFGSAMVSSVGMFGLPIGFSPLAWMYNVPLLVLSGEITEKPVAVDGKVVIRPVLPITATIDHRYADGWHIGALLRPFRAYLADPAAFEPELAPLLTPHPHPPELAPSV